MIPRKPFPTFKWRWLCLTPTEGLLESEVFLGVLRVLALHEGEKASSSNVIADLRRVKNDTGTKVNLARTGDRNLIRNSGQYWKGTGLLQPTRGLIELTNLGREVADGNVTQSEFVAIMVDQTVLPNPWTYSPSEISNWKRAGLRIHPLKLILEVISEIAKQSQLNDSAYLTPEELIKVVIPLSGSKTPAQKIAEYVIRYRANKSIVLGWPDCAPVSNDKRFAREFLLFLSNFGVLRRVEAASGGVEDERFILDGALDASSMSMGTRGLDIFADDRQRKMVVQAVRHSNLPSLIDRKRIAATVLRRSGQDKFRKDVFRAYGAKCLLTGETITKVLEAAHIIPVEKNGSDDVCNSVCLRVDVHRLFDVGNVRILPDGKVVLSDVVRTSTSYRSLPNAVKIPSFVSPANLSWRISYL